MDISERISNEVLGWDDTESRPHRLNGVEFRVNGHEIGHLHGDRLADLPFPRKVREELVSEGKAQTHHVLPQTGPKAIASGTKRMSRVLWNCSAVTMSG